MDTLQAAQCMEALGNETRLSIFRLLVKAGDEGLIVGQIQRALGIPASTLSHHVARLVRCGLVSQERRSRELHCRARYDTMRDVLGFLTDECCTGVSLETEAADLALAD
ncbi:MAG: metalloregulator ArsR/SmtB family transcription factor [Minwuiales bacterium]|nr:metalloregulator ArsR/SmtB family transcription factor [Minwuiales bacterium]